MTFATAYQEKKSHLSTPPIYTGMKGKRKSSVTFNLPENESYEEEEETIFDKEQLLSPCTVTSPTIDICAHTVPDTMLVALFDRSSEMKGLVRHNKTFFLSLQQHLDAKWTRFENTLYCERVKMPDLEWMNRISKALQGVPSLLEKFKELVGYMGEEKHEEEDEDNDDTTSTGDCEYFSTVDIARIRDYPDRISTTSYPQFFINCQGFMQDNARFELFKTTLNNTNRKDYSDESWESEIYKQLKEWPNLLEQLQEIVSYEIEV